MLSLIIIVISLGAFFYLRKQWYEKYPNCQGAKVGALLGVPTFYICYCLTEVVRLYGGANQVFNRTGYQHLMSGTDTRWDADVFASALNNMDNSTRNEWAFSSMAENLSQYVALMVLVMGVLIIYKLLNPLTMPNFKFKTLAIISSFAAVMPYGLIAIGLQNGIIWGIFILILAVFGWTYYLYVKALDRYSKIPLNEIDHKTSHPTQTILTTQSDTACLQRNNQIKKDSDRKSCPYCGEEIMAVAVKCKYCGEWLSKEEEKKLVECPVCGEMVEEGVEICPYCKEKVDGSSIRREETKPKTILCPVCAEEIPANVDICPICNEKIR